MSESVVPNNQNLVFRMQNELGFIPDETGDWLTRSDPDGLGFSTPEQIESVVRIRSDGTRLEFGAHKEDIQKSLALTQFTGRAALSFEDLRDFWPTDMEHVASEDETHLYMGGDIEPTVEGLEKSYSGLSIRLDAAFYATYYGLNYDAANDPERGTEQDIREARELNIATPFARISSYLVTGKVEAEADDELETDDEDDAFNEDVTLSPDERTSQFYDHKAPDLRSYPIGGSENKSLPGAPSSLRVGETTTYWSQFGSHLNSYGDTVRINASSHETNVGWRKFTLTAKIPEGCSIITVADLAQLTHATLHAELIPDSEIELEKEIIVTANAHSLTIIASDDSFESTIHEPACERCETPQWRFGAKPETDSGWGARTGSDEDIFMMVGSSGGQGLYSYSYSLENDHRTSTETNNDLHGHPMYCYDCISEIKTEYGKKYPIAIRRNAVAAIRQTLDAAGYPEVKLQSDSIGFYIDHTSGGHINGLEMPAYLDYERDGRKITRRVGNPHVSLNGEVTLDLESDKFINFR